jgi:hypothetical protein
MTTSNNLFESTQTSIKQWVLNSLSDCTPSERIGIFGHQPFAIFIYQFLIDNGYKNVTFISSTYPHKKLKDCALISPESETLFTLDSVFLASMAASSTQRKVLEDKGFKGQVFALEGGKTLCTEPSFNPINEEKLLALKNKHAGETFYVIGNGPSLNITAPENIREGLLLAGNGIILRSNFMPDYYFILDDICVDAWPSQINQLKVPIIAPTHLYKRLKQIDNTYFYPATYAPASNSIEPAQTGIFSGNTIVCPMILFATYMGASKIIILGVDNNYSRLPDKQYHFDTEYYANTNLVIGEQKGKSLEKRQREGIFLAIEMAQSVGVEVLDATPVENNLGLKKISYEQLAHKTKDALVR